MAQFEAIKTTIKIAGFSRAYSEPVFLHGIGGSRVKLLARADPELTADLEIEVESSDGRKTTHRADLVITCLQEEHLVQMLKWAVGQHRIAPAEEATLHLSETDLRHHLAHVISMYQESRDRRGQTYDVAMADAVDSVAKSLLTSPAKECILDPS